MAKRKKKKKSLEINIDIASISLILIGIILSILVYGSDTGIVGGFIKSVLLGCIGNIMYAIPIILVVLGIYVIFRDFSRLKLKSFLVIIMVFLSSAIISTFSSAVNHLGALELKAPFDYLKAWCEMGINGIGGGIIGSSIVYLLNLCFGMIATKVILWSLAVVVASITTGITLSAIIIAIRDIIDDLIATTRKEFANDKKKYKNNSEKFKRIAAQTSDIYEKAEQLNIDLDGYGDEQEEVEETEKIAEDESDEELQAEEKDETLERLKEEKEHAKQNIKELFSKRKAEEKEDNEPEELNLEHNTMEEYENYEFPSIDLLKQVKRTGKDYSTKELKEIAIKLQKTLASFGVEAKVTNVTRGPTVTRYELQPSVGVKVSKILNLSDDIALNLAAKSIRIEAPIPGKSAVGIEVPNKSTDMVTLREVIESDEFENASSKVSFALGKSIDGVPYVADISKMPHMLISGSTGSGKSVCINSIIMSILYKATPNEVKLILIDPKVVELGVYNGIPHLLIPVVTDPKKAAGALNWAVQEMVNRYNLFASKGVRDIKGYNELLKNEGEEGILPQIVIIVDELADLMMVASNEVEDAICRLAQMARAAGMFLIIATQRPSVDVITGIIKANIPSRIAFTVSSQVDSRTILDMAGAEKLLGRGDMLFLPIGEAKPIRLQGAFVSDGEIESVVDAIKESTPAVYNQNVIEKLEKNDTAQVVSDDEDDCDEYLTDAIELAVNMGQVSASMIQRKFRVGYARAGRIVDQMEERGIISESQGSKPRKTLISKEEWEEMKEQGDVSFEDSNEEDDYESEETEE
jgi:S-DNA-T family DNA segregation ATPase FtsK/SpoIIIE